MATFARGKNKTVTVVGPQAMWLSCSFTTSGSTSGVTTNEARGVTVSRTGVGTFVIVLPQVFKDVNVTMSVQAASTAQLFIITARDLAAKTITIKQVTAGGGTAVDTLAARVDVQILARQTS